MEDKKRKTVFRQLLDSPFNLTWKSVDQKTSNDILDVLCSLLAPLASHRTIDASHKRKRGKHDCSTPLFMDPPPLVSSMTIGFNPTTQHLESEIKNSSNGRMKVVFVCRGDTTSTHLYAHFPLIASMLSSLRVVSLAKGAESRLCEALLLKRVGVIGLMDNAPGVDILFQLVLEKVPEIEVPWKQDGGISFIPTRVKWIESLGSKKRSPKKEEKKKERQKNRLGTEK